MAGYPDDSMGLKALEVTVASDRAEVMAYCSEELKSSEEKSMAEVICG